MIPAREKLAGPSSAAVACSITNAELVQKLRTDPGSVASLFYELYEPRIRGIVYGMLGPDPDHHDLVQQIFIKLLKSGFDLREPDTLPGWIRSVTVCAVYEELRRRRARRRLEASFVNRLTRDFAREVEARDLLVRVVRMIEHLPRGERDAFVMRVVEGRTCREVATITGCSIATVKRRLSRANRRLLSMLARNAELSKLPRGRAARRSGTRTAGSSALQVPDAPN